MERDGNLSGDDGFFFCAPGEGGLLMLKITDLTLIHRADRHTLVENAALTLNRGDRIVLLGEEGNGKSTLLRWIYDSRLVADYIEWRGGKSDSGEKYGYLPQSLTEEELDMPVYAFTGMNPAFEGSSARQRARAAASLALSEALFYDDRAMRSLSGGERVKLLLALLSLDSPDILLLDEPSNDIDMDTLDWLERFILRHEGIVLFISHDETLIARTANRVALMEQLRHKQKARFTVANMPFEAFMRERAAAFEKQARLAGSERREARQAQERFERIRQKVESRQDSISRADPHGGRLLKKKMAAVKALERRYDREHAQMTDYPEYETSIALSFDRPQGLPPSREVLALHIDSLDAPDGRRLCGEISLSVRGRDRVCVIGRNGCGKTTLLRRIERELKKGELRVAVMPQDYGAALDGDMTPIAFLAPDGDRETVTLVRTRLGAMKFTPDEMTHPIRFLSGGQRAKALLLSLSLSGADVLLLDEPTRNFSPLSGPQVRALIASFPGAVISVSHDRRFISEVCTRVYRLDEDGLREWRAE